MDEIIVLVKRIKAYMNRHLFLNTMMTGFFCVMICCIAIALTARTIPFYYEYVIEIGVFVIGFLYIGIVFLKKKFHIFDAAKYIDSFGLKERFITVLDSEKEENSPFRVALIEDTKNQIEKMDRKSLFSIPFPKKRMAAVLLLAAIFAILLILPSPIRDQAKTDHIITKVSKEQEQELKKLEEEITKSEELQENEKAVLLEQLALSLDELKKATSMEEIEKAIQKIEKKVDNAMENANVAANSKLAAAVQNTLDSMAKKEANGKKALGQDNKEKQEASGEGDSSKKENGESEGNKTVNTDTPPGEEGSSGSEDATGNTSSSSGSTVQGNQGQSQESGNGEQSPNGNTGGESAGNPSGNGNNENEQENQSGEPGDGNQGSQGSSSGSGNNSGTSGRGWNYGSENGKEDSLEKGKSITIDKAVGNDENLTDDEEKSGSSSSQKTTTAGSYNGKTVNYESVLSQYQNKAYSSISKNEYPGTMSQYIKNYFDALNQ